jgi:tRNA/rRNA methyltransferase
VPDYFAGTMTRYRPTSTRHDAGLPDGRPDHDGRDTRAALTLPPVVVLVGTQLGENIGTAIRAMANFGLKELRLVSPREPWPNERGLAAASGADAVIGSITVYDDLPAAIADCGAVYATTARPREMVKPVLGPDEAAARTVASAAGGVRTAILFGRERTGLVNDEIALAEAILTLPVDPAFASLNLAQAVLIVGYAWRRAVVEGDLPFITEEASRPANKAEMIALFEHVERALEPTGYFRSADKRPTMVRNLRGILQKAPFTEQEVRTLRGVFAALEGRPFREKVARGPAQTPPKPRPPGVPRGSAAPGDAAAEAARGPSPEGEPEW